MGKPTGFMEFERELPPDRSPLERLNDWQEFHDHFSEAKLQQQGGRCMDGVRFRARQPNWGSLGLGHHVVQRCAR